MRASLFRILAVGASLWSCGQVLGLGDLKDGPDPNTVDASSDSGSSSGGTCGGATCAAAQQCDNGQCCPMAPGGGSCDVFPPCGCAVDENCARIGGAPEKCVAAGTVAVLGNCQDTSDCRAGLVCADTLCEPPCAGTCPTEAFDCLAQRHSFSDGGVEALGFSACEPHCNPVFPQNADALHVACSAAERCEVSSNGDGITYCDYPAGSGTQGSACSKQSECATGYHCFVPEGGSGVCERYCHLGGGFNVSCATGTTCQSLPTATYDRTLPIGVCQ
jgi:hypothetical protein